MFFLGGSVWRTWWWVAAFCSLSLFAYCQSSAEKKQAIAELAARIEELSSEKIVSEQLKEELLLAVASQEDPAWIEMVLMRDLGVVPEGWLKVHFKR
jgi:hypothetical protein